MRQASRFRNISYVCDPPALTSRQRGCAARLPTTVCSISVTCVIMQKNGAGLHTASSCFWDSSTDGRIPTLFHTLLCPACGHKSGSIVTLCMSEASSPALARWDPHLLGFLTSWACLSPPQGAAQSDGRTRPCTASSVPLACPSDLLAACSLVSPHF